MNRKPSKKGSVYYCTSDDSRNWVDIGEIPAFKKMFAELSNVNNRLDRLETKLVKFADSHGLSHNGSMESVIYALMNEIQLIQAGKAYTAVQMENGYIVKSLDANAILNTADVPTDIGNGCYRLVGNVLELDSQKLNEMEEL